MEEMESCPLRTLSREKLSRAHALDTAMAREREKAELTFDLGIWGPTCLQFSCWSFLVCRQKLA
jgi:hypothetical protein